MDPTVKLDLLITLSILALAAGALLGSWIGRP